MKRVNLRISRALRWLMVILSVLVLVAACTGGNDPQVPETGGEPAQAATTAVTIVAPQDTPAAVPSETPFQANATTQEPAEQTSAVVAETTEPKEQSATTFNCEVGTPATPANMEGPYFTPGSPEKPSLLEPGMEGTRLVITGFVLNTDCQPIPGAKLDFWQADANGAYDNSGYRLRGHQFSAEDGSYRLETVLPADYGGRPRHIHVKVLAPDKPELTTQMYFAGEARNQNEAAFLPELAVEVTETADGGLEGQFNFFLP